MSAPLLKARGISVAYGTRRRPITALHPTDLDLHAGESVAVVGRSGAGKSTLAEIVLGLRTASTGHVSVAGERFCGAGRAPHRRCRHLVQGVPQDAGASLPPGVPVRVSIERAIDRLGVGRHDARAAAGAALDAATAADRILAAAKIAHLDPALLDRTPRQLSGGQAQRAAIARAVAVGPRLIVADEPTSALDARTAAGLADALLALPGRTGGALLLVTHDDALAARCDRILTVRDGVVTPAPGASRPGTAERAA
ncbi:ATP-binding cassette domain-containing protein [Zhihengliuella sp.]|uniref:ATP-binding cassette domain-containing protein n=1 Tax=Zhihengliuella sp. TaxID=1954483 RepID=UPI0028115769|nr:ATP-binding cassette domain-containing protein [Zhihengliuella sp.]